MKKVIEKMGAAAAEEQRRALSTTPAATGSGKDGKRRWLGGAIRKVTGGSGSASASASAAAAPSTAAAGAEEDEGGLQVDYYLVIVRNDSLSLSDAAC